mgnify:CR=1 FL=1
MLSTVKNYNYQVYIIYSMPELIESRNLFISTKDTIFAKIHTEVTSGTSSMQIKDISVSEPPLNGLGVSGEGIAKDTIVTNFDSNTSIVTLSKPTTKIISVDTPIAFNSMDNFTVDLSKKKIRNPSGIIKYSKLTLIDFNMYRNFPLVNETNNRVYLTFTHSGEEHTATIQLTKQDYGGIGEIALEFATKIAFAISTELSIVGNANEIVVDTFSPAVTYNKGTTGTGIFEANLKTANLTLHGITSMKLQCRQYASILPLIGDSYALLGGKRIGEESVTASSFTIENPDASKIKVEGYYPMQRHTTPYVYLRCVKPATTNNIESTSVTDGPSDSNILAKIPVQNELISYVSNANSPYFIKTRQKESDITSLQFQLTDENDRALSHIDNEQTSKGNAFCEMTINHSIYL